MLCNLVLTYTCPLWKYKITNYPEIKMNCQIIAGTLKE